jgi:glycine/D-amino acid oxidase-like deaminating enzyme
MDARPCGSSRASPDRVTTALLVPSHGYVGPTPLVEGLIKAGARRGVSMVTARARRVEDRGEAVLTTDDGVIGSDALVIATGSWTGSLLDTSCANVVKPIRGQLLHLSLESRVAARVVWGADCYVVPWRTERCWLVPLSRMSASTRQRRRRAFAVCSTRLSTSCLRWGEARFREARAGLRPKTSDELPAIGRSSTMPHVFYCGRALPERSAAGARSPQRSLPTSCSTGANAPSCPTCVRIGSVCEAQEVLLVARGRPC